MIKSVVIPGSKRVKLPPKKVKKYARIGKNISVFMFGGIVGALLNSHFYIILAVFSCLNIISYLGYLGYFLRAKKWLKRGFLNAKLRAEERRAFHEEWTKRQGL